MITRSRVLLCNCAGCGKPLLAERYRDLSDLERATLATKAFGGSAADVVAGRHCDRPYCFKCLIEVRAQEVGCGE